MTPELKTAIEGAFFHDEDFETTWMEVNQEYDALGFRDDIDDATRISEYKYIAQQLRKYKFSKQDAIMSHDDVEGMAAEVAALIAKAREYGDSRKEVVYNFMRDHWLINLYNTLARLLTVDDDEEEESDE